jgi:hypothetical protein
MGPGNVIANATFLVMYLLWKKEEKTNWKHRFYISYFLKKRSGLDLLSDLRVEDIGHFTTSVGYSQVLKF